VTLRLHFFARALIRLHKKFHLFFLLPFLPLSVYTNNVLDDFPNDPFKQTHAHHQVHVLFYSTFFFSPLWKKRRREFNFCLFFVFFLFFLWFVWFPLSNLRHLEGGVLLTPLTGLRRKYFAYVIITLPTIKAKKLSLSFFFQPPQAPENNFVSLRRPVCRCVILHWLGCIWRKWMHGSRRRRMDNSVNTSLETGSCQLRNPELT
jgi:hypothetical protein